MIRGRSIPRGADAHEREERHEPRRRTVSSPPPGSGLQAEWTLGTTALDPYRRRTMPPEAPLLFSIAGLSASLAGLAGLVAGLRRGPTLAPMELYRLREIVEFSFANVLLALSTVVLPNAVGARVAIAIVAATGVLYLVFDAAILFRRLARAAIPVTRPWVVAASVIDAMAIVIGLGAIGSGEMNVLEALFILLLARPMVAFLFVLSSFETAAKEVADARSRGRPEP